MKIKGRRDDMIEITDDEEKLMSGVIKLFESKGIYAGADFRVAFVSAVMDGYCDACGRGGDFHCHCTRDD